MKLQNVMPAQAPLFLCAAILSAFQIAGLFHSPVLALLEWSRADLSDGQWWRLLTGHWVHLGLTHLGLNLAGLILVGLLFQRPAPSAWFWGYLLAAPATISIAFLWMEPALDWYRGFSGCLHGLFVLTAFANLRGHPKWSLLLLAILFLKLALEPFYPGGTAGLIGAPVIYTSHWAGAFTGLVAGALLVIKEARRPPSGE